MKHILVQSILFVKLFIRRTMDIIQMVGTNIRSYCFYCLHLIIFAWNIWKVCVLFPAINNDSHHIQTCSVCETQFFFNIINSTVNNQELEYPLFDIDVEKAEGRWVKISVRRLSHFRARLSFSPSNIYFVWWCPHYSRLVWNGRYKSAKNSVKREDPTIPNEARKHRASLTTTKTHTDTSTMPFFSRYMTETQNPMCQEILVG